MNKDALLTLHDVSAGYEGRTIISRVSIEVDRHTLLALQGPNGSGKTTMVRVMLGQLAPMHGHVIRQPNMRVGYMPQMVRADLDFPISVRDVILMGSAHASLWGRERRISLTLPCCKMWPTNPLGTYRAVSASASCYAVPL